MKAVRLHGAGDLRVEAVPAPGAPVPGWVRLTVTAAGICGSDLHNYRTGQWITRAPSIAGHELAGVVAALGDGVEGFVVGDTVVADSRVWCGECPACRTGRRHLCERLGFVGEACDGGFAEEIVLPARLLLPLAPFIDPAVAAMAEPLAVALHAVRRLAPRHGEPVLVVGCGPIGGLAALVLARDHDGPILLADRNAARAVRVAEVTGGSVTALDADALRAALGGRLPGAAVEATGSPAALDALIGAVAGGARVALVGIYHGRLALDPNLLVEREIDLVGCHAFTDELTEAVARLPQLAGDLARLIDRQIGLDAVPDAYARLLKGEAQGLKTIIRPGGVPA
ncbi:(R,R)-butanediol dehydrogenase/meso-butanediol dehydrogenase/diacetyl reductase [Angulomicrobium tetraedrale]|uniref:(R,R)-butanediol dehydrogenase/meso-butanediol dehydrogenase/diacetyl reductase n=1 Tax=Ancylobacter tetraedralis TaxID=217068 RepID=A0A839Z908_9HYPH|nr:alcohol dehydrogenase catalytic domain-containing protein [Ancylobacter tetraedralis]MBB3770925.1 (R,R)-butanediol dehydrogenase/meso-butanediol dehydrogenase/diacetyl reductase [Ancylobacter tetraedralis]